MLVPFCFLSRRFGLSAPVAMALICFGQLVTAQVGQSDSAGDSPAQDRPNIIIIYADDMGLGDVSYYANHLGSATNVETPHIDRLAQQGTTFLHGYSANGVCTPSRYSLLTGVYNWRNFSGITLGYGSKAPAMRSRNPDMPDPSELPRAEDYTIAEYLQDAGYHTAALGKWHLGGVWINQSDGSPVRGNPRNNESIDWSAAVAEHATSHGFEDFMGLAASINMPPYVYMDGAHHTLYVPEQDAYLPILKDSPENQSMLQANEAITQAQATDGNPHNGEISMVGRAQLAGTDPNIAQAAIRPGLGDHSFRTQESGPKLSSDFQTLLERRSERGDQRPLFAYVSLYGPHLPWSVAPEFRQHPNDVEAHAESDIYSAYVRQMDAQVGEILSALEHHQLLENSLLVFTADNGPSAAAMVHSLAHGHDPNSTIRAHKSHVWEGGTRVPFIVSWPGHSQAAKLVSTPVSHVDLFATLPHLLSDSEVVIPADTPLDGISILAEIVGTSEQQTQPTAAEQRQGIIVSSRASHLSLITPDQWKYIPANQRQTLPIAPPERGLEATWDEDNKRISSRDSNQTLQRNFQLYQLSNDQGEANNLLAGANNLQQARQLLIQHTGRDLHEILQQMVSNQDGAE